MNGRRDEMTNVTSSSTQKDDVSDATCLEVSSLEPSSSPPPQESKCDSIPSIDSCPTIDAYAVEESIEQPKANNREDTPEPEGIHDSLHTSSSTISADDDVKEESTSKEEESDSEPISQGDNISDPSREVDFVEPSKRARLDYSTYDKNSFSSDVGNLSPIAGLDSRMNPFEEGG